MRVVKILTINVQIPEGKVNFTSNKYCERDMKRYVFAFFGVSVIGTKTLQSLKLILKGLKMFLI